MVLQHLGSLVPVDGSGGVDKRFVLMSVYCCGLRFMMNLRNRLIWTKMGLTTEAFNGPLFMDPMWALKSCTAHERYVSYRYLP